MPQSKDYRLRHFYERGVFLANLFNVNTHFLGYFRYILTYFQSACINFLLSHFIISNYNLTERLH